MGNPDRKGANTFFEKNLAKIKKIKTRQVLGEIKRGLSRRVDGEQTLMRDL